MEKEKHRNDQHKTQNNVTHERRQVAEVKNSEAGGCCWLRSSPGLGRGFTGIHYI